MTNKSSAYKDGYMMARANLEAEKPSRERKAVEQAMKGAIRELAAYDKILEGAVSAMWDYEHATEWEF